MFRMKTNKDLLSAGTSSTSLAAVREREAPAELCPRSVFNSSKREGASVCGPPLAAALMPGGPLPRTQ